MSTFVCAEETKVLSMMLDAKIASKKGLLNVFEKLAQGEIDHRQFMTDDNDISLQNKITTEEIANQYHIEPHSAYVRNSRHNTKRDGFSSPSAANLLRNSTPYLDNEYIEYGGVQSFAAISRKSERYAQSEVEIPSTVKEEENINERIIIFNVHEQQKPMLVSKHQTSNSNFSINPKTSTVISAAAEPLTSGMSSVREDSVIILPGYNNYSQNISSNENEDTDDSPIGHILNISKISSAKSRSRRAQSFDAIHDGNSQRCKIENLR